MSLTTCHLRRKLIDEYDFLNDVHSGGIITTLCLHCSLLISQRSQLIVMAPKRKAGSTKPADKGAVKKAKPTKAAPPTALETVQSALSNVAETVSKAMDVAGELTLDDGSKTPVGIEEALGETVDVPTLKKKGKKAQAATLEQGQKVVEQAKPLKGKAAKAAADAESAAEAAIENKTGVDVKAAKGKAAKAAKAAQEKVDETVAVVQPEVEKAAKAAKPLKGKAAKAAQQAQSTVESTVEDVKEAAQDPKNRKKAEDFMHTAEEGVMAAVNKVGEVVGGVVKTFGEASGLTADVDGISPKVKKGKKAVEDKAAEVAEPAKKKGTQAKKAAEDTAGDVAETVQSKGAKGKKAVEETTKQAKGKAAKGQEAVEATIEAAKPKATKGKKAAEQVVDETATAAKAKGGKAKKIAEDAADTATTGKRKAAAAAETVDSAPATKKAKDAAGTVVEKGKKAGKAAVKAAADAVEEAAESDSESFIHGFSSSDGEADSSDDESDDEDAAVKEAGRRVDMSQVPMIAKDDKSVQARLKKAQKKKVCSSFLRL